MLSYGKILPITSLFLFVSTFFSLSTAQNFVDLKNLIKPKDIEYHFTITFHYKKSTEQKFQQEIKNLQEKYKIKVVRRKNELTFEVVALDNNYDIVSSTIYEENKTKLYTIINPLLSKDKDRYKIDTTKIKIIYRPYAKPYQIDLIEKLYKLKLFTSEKINNHNVFTYLIKDNDLIKQYNILRKIKKVQSIGLITEEPENGVIWIDDMFRMPNVVLGSYKKNSMPETFTIDGKVFKVIKDIEGRYYVEKTVIIFFKRFLTKEERWQFLQKYNLQLLSASYPDMVYAEIMQNKTVDEMIKILNNDPLVLQVTKNSLLSTL